MQYIFTVINIIILSQMLVTPSLILAWLVMLAVKLPIGYHLLLQPPRLGAAV